jgi:hypothetical protein
VILIGLSSTRITCLKHEQRSYSLRILTCHVPFVQVEPLQTHLFVFVPIILISTYEVSLSIFWWYF